MADFEEKITITVAGGDSLARAGAEAEGAAKGVGKLKDELAELGGASAGADAAGASMGHIRDDALEAAAAVEALKRAEAGAGSGSGGGGLSRDLIAAGAAARGIEKDLGRISGGGSGRSGLSRISRDAGDAEKGLRDVEGAAGDAAQALGAGGGIAGGLNGAFDDLGESFGKVQALGMPALLIGAASAASTIGPALLATGAGIGAWGAFAAPAVLKVKNAFTSVSAAQSAYQSAVQANKNDPTAANAKAQSSALAALHTAWASLPPDISRSVSSLQGVEKAFGQASKPIQAQALKDIPKVASDVKGLIPSLSKLASAGGSAVGGLLGDFGKFEKSSGFKGFISNIASEVPGAVGPLRKLGSALGAITTQLFSKSNVATGDKFISSLANLAKAYGPGAVKGLNEAATDFTKINNALAKSSKPGGDVSNTEKIFDWLKMAGGEAVGPYASGLKALNRGGKALQKPTNPLERANADLSQWFTDATFGHVYIPGQGNPRPGTPGLGESLRTTAAGMLNPKGAGGMLAPQLGQLIQPQGKQAAGGATVKIRAEVSGASGAESELRKLRAYTSKSEKMKIEVTATGADKAKNDFQGIVTAAKTAGTKAGASIAPGIQAGAGPAKGAATSVAGGVKGAVAPLPGQLQAIGASAGAGMAAGISSETGAVSAAAAGLAAAAAAAARVKLKSHSPSKVFEKIGQDTWEGYVLGLQGGQSQVDAAMKALLGADAPFKDSAITSTVKSLRREIGLAASSGKINPLQKMGLTQLLDQDNPKLMALAQKRQSIISKINGAESLAKSVQQAAAQGADLGTIAASTITGQQDASAASGSGNIADVPTGPATLAEGLQGQLKSDQTFNKQLKELKKEGLDKAGIRQLANDGVAAGSEAASQILAGGKKGVQAIAQLDNSIGLASKKLGITAGNAAYESGSQVGGQLAAGLKSELKAVNQQMASLEKGLMTAIMLGLGDSPKQIKAAMAKLDKELGLSAGTTAGGGGKVTAPHKIYVPKTSQGRFAQPGPIGGTPPHVVTPAFAGAGANSGGPIVVNLTSTLVVSGRALAKVTQTKTLQRAASNTSSGLVLPGRTS